MTDQDWISAIANSDDKDSPVTMGAYSDWLEEQGRNFRAQAVRNLKGYKPIFYSDWKSWEWSYPESDDLGDYGQGECPESGCIPKSIWDRLKVDRHLLHTKFTQGMEDEEYDRNGYAYVAYYLPEVAWSCAIDAWEEELEESSGFVCACGSPDCGISDCREG